MSVHSALGRGHLKVALALACALAVAACSMGSGRRLSQQEKDEFLGAPTSPVESQPLGGPAASGDQIGSGPTRIGLVVPLTQGPRPRTRRRYFVAQRRRTGGGGIGSNDITVLVKDDPVAPEGARAAAQAAVSEGAELLIGPLFAPDVRETGRVARPAGKPVIAFSTDTSAATRGVYLLSFLVESYVDRIIDFAASRGKRSVAALVPQNDYGNVALAEFQQVAARRGLRVMMIERYTPSTLAASVQKIAALGGQIDTLFIPEQTEAMGAVSQQLSAARNRSRQSATARHRALERRTRPEIAGPAGRLVRRAGKWRLQPICRTLSRQVRQRSNAYCDARL